MKHSTIKYFLSFLILYLSAFATSVKADLVLDVVTSVIIPAVVVPYNKLHYPESPVANDTDDWKNPKIRWHKIHYNRAILKDKCNFEDCDLGFSVGDHWHLPTVYSDVEDNLDNNLMGNLLGNLFGTFGDIGEFFWDSLVEGANQGLILSGQDTRGPVEHTQGSIRLADVGNNAYFMFSSSRHNSGVIWIVELKGVSSSTNKNLNEYTSANVVWWRIFNKCTTLDNCNLQTTEGTYNHPANFSRVGHVIAVGLQNFSKHGQPHKSNLYSHDAIGFYDVSDPLNPIFLRRLVSSIPSHWGGNLPGNDLPEVTLSKVGNYYHLSVGDDSRKHYKMNSPYSSSSVEPLSIAHFIEPKKSFGKGMILTKHENKVYPTIVNSLVYAGPNETMDIGYITYDPDDGFYYKPTKVNVGVGLALVGTRLTYDPEFNNNLYSDTVYINEPSESQGYGKLAWVDQNIEHSDCELPFYRFRYSGGGYNDQDIILYCDNQVTIWADKTWERQACNYAAGINVQEDGSLNAVCHAKRSDSPDFLVRTVGR